MVKRINTIFAVKFWARSFLRDGGSSAVLNYASFFHATDIALVTATSQKTDTADWRAMV